MRMLVFGMRAAIASVAIALPVGCGGSTEVQLAKVPPAKAEAGIATKKEGVPVPKGPKSSGMMRNPISSP